MSAATITEDAPLTAIARVHYTDETDAGRTYHSVAVYTEEALARLVAEYTGKGYQYVEARRYPV
jgi:hypothetical protein